MSIHPQYRIPGGTDDGVADFDLQPSDVPQPKEVDEELATRDWPMPAAKPWAPAPARDSLFWQVVEALL